jgi:cell division protein FtsB
MDESIEDLKTDRDSLEKFAREQFHFAVPGEDVYIVEE